MSIDLKNIRAGFLVHTLELKLWHTEVSPYVCMWKPCICNVSRPLYVSVHYLENSPSWPICLRSMALAILCGFWTFFLLSVVHCLKKINRSVLSSVKHFNPHLSHGHAECPETRKMFVFDSHFRIKVTAL